MIDVFTPVRIKDKWLIQSVVPLDTEEKALEYCSKAEQYERIVNRLNQEIDTLETKIRLITNNYTLLPRDKPWEEIIQEALIKIHDDKVSK